MIALTLQGQLWFSAEGFSKTRKLRAAVLLGEDARLATARAALEPVAEDHETPIGRARSHASPSFRACARASCRRRSASPSRRRSVVRSKQCTQDTCSSNSGRSRSDRRAGSERNLSRWT